MEQVAREPAAATVTTGLGESLGLRWWIPNRGEGVTPRYRERGFVRGSGYGPGVDWSTVLASAGVSAVVGAVVSLLTVSQTTVRRARAERRETARLAVADTAAPLVRELTRYRFQRENGKPRRDNANAHLDDLGKVMALRKAAANLSWWRRWLVDRRCRRVFGDYWADLARDYPSDRPAGESEFSTWLAASMSDRHRGDPRESLIHRTYAAPPADPLAGKLARELRLLAAAW